eukprot:6213343-Pleurochrysis_carterae.AAC.2
MRLANTRIHLCLSSSFVATTASTSAAEAMHRSQASPCDAGPSGLGLRDIDGASFAGSIGRASAAAPIEPPLRCAALPGRSNALSCGPDSIPADSISARISRCTTRTEMNETTNGVTTASVRDSPQSMV